MESSVLKCAGSAQRENSQFVLSETDASTFRKSFSLWVENTENDNNSSLFTNFHDMNLRNMKIVKFNTCDKIFYFI